MKLSKSQLNLVSEYFADLSKILFGSAILAYFIPEGASLVTPTAFILGSLTAALTLLAAVVLSPETLSHR